MQHHTFLTSALNGG